MRRVEIRTENLFQEIKFAQNLDAADKCPTQAEDKDSFEDDDGCPEYDRDGDGIHDQQDVCPDQAEDKDGYKDEDGCPDADNDGDGLADAKDKCPNVGEDKDGFQDEDGCPDPDNDKDLVLDIDDQCARLTDAGLLVSNEGGRRLLAEEPH